MKTHYIQFVSSPNLIAFCVSVMLLIGVGALLLPFEVQAQDAYLDEETVADGAGSGDPARKIKPKKKKKKD